MASMPALVKKLPQEGDIRAASMLQQHLSTSSIDASAARVHQQHQSFPGNDERMSVLHQDSGGIGKSIPSALEIFLGRGFCTPRPSGCKTHGLGKSLGFPSTLEISLGLRPREISWVSGNWAAGMDFPIPPSSWWSTDTIQNLTLRKLFHLDAADDMVTRVMMKRKGIKPVYTWLELLRIKSGSNALHCNIFWLIQLSTPALKLYRIAFL